jgi:cell division protease FtsH
MKLVMLWQYIYHSDDVFKITVKSHQGSLGFVTLFPKEELHNADHNVDREKLTADIL